MRPTHLFTFADGSTLHSISARELAKFLVWEGNRARDVAHVESLWTSIKNPRSIQGPFTVIESPEATDAASSSGAATSSGASGSGTTYKILDGQHRAAVLARYFAETPEAEDFPVLARRYGADTIPTHEEAIRKFREINNAKPMIYKGSVTERLHQFVTALTTHFVRKRKSDAIFMIRSGCNRPFLSVDALSAALVKYRVNEREDLTPEGLVAHAVTMNALYAEDPAAHISVPVTATMLDRAREYDFFLGLDPKCPWLIPLMGSLPGGLIPLMGPTGIKK